MYINFEVITRGSNYNFHIRKVELALLNMDNSKHSMHCRRLWYDPKIQPVQSTIVPPEKLQESFIEARRCHQDKSGDRPVDKWLVPQPLPSYLNLVKDSWPIAQEISMVLLIIALHRGLVKGTSIFCRHPWGFCTDQENLQSLIFSVILLCSLFVVIIFSKGNIETSTEPFVVALIDGITQLMLYFIKEWMQQIMQMKSRTTTTQNTKLRVSGDVFLYDSLISFYCLQF